MIELFPTSIKGTATFYLDAEMVSLYRPSLGCYYDRIGVSFKYMFGIS